VSLWCDIIQKSRDIAENIFRRSYQCRTAGQRENPPAMSREIDVGTSDVPVAMVPALWLRRTRSLIVRHSRHRVIRDETDGGAMISIRAELGT
jgi:hypothetical protein